MAGRAKKPARRVIYHSSDTESEDDVLNRRRSRRANLPKNPNPPADIQDDTFVVGEDDFFEEGRDHYMKIATDVVDKNVKLTKLFDPDVMQGFTMIMNKSEKVGQATKAMEACTKVYTQKVDTLHTNVQKLSSTMVRIEEKPKRKEKRVAFEEKNLNDWLAEGADDLNNSGINDGIFSGEEDENRPIIRGAEMTVTGDFLRDQTLLPGSQDLDLSLTMDDDPESFHMGEKIQQFVNNRSLLTKGKKLTLEQLEVRFARADAAVERFNQIERIKKFGKTTQKKEVETEEPSSNFAYLDIPLFFHAKTNRGEKTNVSLEDFAETNDDCSLVYLHNNWKESDEPEMFAKMDEELEDWTMEEDLLDENDMVLGVLDHVHGALEYATSSEPTLPEDLIDLFGLSRKDLKKIKHMESYLNVSFEQTTSTHIDEGNMVEQLEITEEEEAVKKELERTNSLVLELFRERTDLPGKAQNPRETSIRQEMHRPKYTKCFDDEDSFFNYDFKNWMTKETLDKEIAHVSRYWMKSLTKKLADELKVPESLYDLLKASAENNSAFSQDLLDAFKLIPDYIYGKLLLLDPDVGINYGEEIKRLELASLPFRISRYAQLVVSTVLHEVQKADLCMADLQRPVQSRAASVMNNRSVSVMQMTYNNMVSPSKKSRFDETIPEGWTYFYAKERNYWKRYSDQELYDETRPYIRELLIMTILSEEAQPSNKGDNDPAVLDGFWALITAIRFYEDHVTKDLTGCLVTERIPIIENEEQLPEIEITTEREEILKNLANIEKEKINKNEQHPEFENNWDFHTPPSSPINGPTLQQSMSSIDLFNGENDIPQIDNDIENEPERPATTDIDFPDFDNYDNEELNDSFTAMIQDFHEPPEEPSAPRRRSRKFTKFVEDNAHYDEEDQTKRKERKKREDDVFGEQLTFAPRKQMEHVSTTRRRTRSKSTDTQMDNAAINLDPVVLPDKFKIPVTFRVDDQLVLTIPGMGDINRMFVPVPVLKNGVFSSIALLYKGAYSQLPPTSSTRQDEDLFFFTNYQSVVREFQEIRMTEAAGQSGIGNGDEIDLNMSFDDGNDFDFDAPDIVVRSLEEHSGRSEVVANVDDFEKEYGNASIDTDMGIDEEDDVFDFESRMSKREARVMTNYKFKLKRAIKFILSRKFLDRSSISENINGLPIPPSHVQELFSSTPSKLKIRPIEHLIIDDDDDMDILATNLEVNLDVEDEEDTIIRQETDETRMKSFKIQGFHTFRSVLYYLPTYCCPETVETLSTAHVFSILCHMANENILHVTQEMYTVEDDVDERIDYVIEDYDTWLARIAEEEIDDMRRSDDDD